MAECISIYIQQTIKFVLRVDYFNGFVLVNLWTILMALFCFRVDYFNRFVLFSCGLF